ncbi:STAS domain-containing protein [Microbispora hainanensis]|uniref:STAS domain-containing protein n=1 Tax=Microbispora hainanensis TaxID=568844 RepID=A0A544YR63_9ACTN|nr:STAS domain-containing protein [Microbispora hainanensis]TQS19002.1 STAS domain-containing protein [Microbispora hainanensis]
MKDTPPFQVESLTPEPGTARLVMTGELDYTTADDASAEVAKALAAGVGVLEFDLAGLQFIDSSGMAVVMNAYIGAQERGTAFRIVALTPYLRHLIEVVALDDVLDLPG